MKHGVPVKNGIIIPDSELEITTSRAGGPGGQHVNKSDTRITVRWNVKTTTVLSPEQKERIMRNLQTRLTSDGDLLVHNSQTRSQQDNKQLALMQLAHIVSKALHVPKKRMATRATQAARETRLQKKTYRSALKKTRSKKHYHD